MLSNPSLESKALFFEIRLNSVAPGVPIPCDLYLIVNAKPILFRKRGDVFTADRMKQLNAHGAATLLVPTDQRTVYLSGIRSLIADPDASAETRGQIIKEAAYLQLKEIFVSPNPQEVVQETEVLVKDMVLFLGQNAVAAQSLLKVSAHDNYTFNHSVNVAVYSILLAKRLNGIDPKTLMMAGLAGLLHDVGKRDLPSTILRKLTPLTPEEDSAMRQHPQLGIRLLDTVPEIPAKVKEVVVQHHENYDGSGYPKGLSGEQISRLTRVVSIADTFDSLTTERHGQKAFNPQEALDLMSTLQPNRFDPAIFLYFNKNTTTKTDVMLPKNFDPCSPQPVMLIKK